MASVGLHPFLAAARRRHRQMARRAAENDLGRLPRYADRQDGRRDLRPQSSACAPQCRAPAPALASSGCSWRRTASASKARNTGSAERRASSSPGSSCSPPARSTQRRCCCGRRERGLANRSDMVGRHFMNHNASAVLAIDPRVVNDSVYQKTLGDQRFLSRRRPRRPAARQHPTARPRHRADPQGKHQAGAGMGAGLGQPARRRLVRDERGPAEPRKPRDRRRRADPARLEAQQLGARTSNSSSGCKRTAARRGLSDRPFATFRPADAFPSVRHRAHRDRTRRQRRSIHTAAPSTIPISSSSTLRSCRPRRRVNPSLTDRRAGASGRRPHRQDGPSTS